MPKKVGDRVKTDRRDAEQLARMHRSGELDAIHVPDPVDEAIRNLCRARFDAKQDGRRGKQQLKSLLLRNGCAYLGKSGWTPERKAYLRERPMQHPAQRAAMESYIRSIDHAGSRIEDIETQLELLCPDWELYGLATALIELLCPDWELYGLATALMDLKGVAWLTATSLAAELGDMRRFPGAPAMMAYLGLSPSEHSSGQRARKGAITKAGNSHARFYLVESAQHYFRPPKVSKELTRRQIGVDQEILDLSWQAQLRLNKRYWALARRGMRVQKIQVAVARELAGFVWAAGQKEWLYDPGDD